PTLRHNPSSQVVQMNNKFFMVDCGEGTQLALRHTHINFNKLSAVFISHLHGDHCLGLTGMISTFGLLGRTAPLHIYAPKELQDILPPRLAAFTRELGFKVILHDVDTSASAIIYEDRSLTVESIPLEHRIPTAGYLFREKTGRRHIIREMTDYYQIPYSRLNRIRDGEDWEDAEGNIIPNDRLTAPPTPPRSYAYCSDTRYIPALAEKIRGVNLLYHESTYASDNIARAETYSHSTAAQAAQVASDAHAGGLLLGHYSQRYDDESILLDEARAIFPDTRLSDEGMIFDVK
ncbi:MAG: ribonuclease Z, partial [Prevotella sp.]|nr:ribonuclease Z [Prevotella sp.]